MRYQLLISVLLNLLYATYALSSLPRVHINKDHLFEDANGQIRIYHGTSFVNKEHDLVKISEKQMRIFKDEWGMNFARIGFLWNLVEIQPGVYNETYLDLLVDLVERFHKHDIYVLLDMHQDLWAPQYCGHGFPDFYSLPYNNPNYKRGGSFTFPEPVQRPKYSPNATGPYPHISNCDQVGKKIGWVAGYLTYSLGAGSQKLYDNEDHYMDKFGDFWAEIARRFQNETAVLGYELINEPWLGDQWNDLKLLIPGNSDRRNLQPLYDYLNKRIRKYDDEAMIFYESGYAGNFYDRVGFTEAPGGVEYNDRQVLSYHMYCPMVQGDLNVNGTVWKWIYKILGWTAALDCNIAFSLGVLTRQRDIKRLGGGGMLTEFGALDFNLTQGVSSLKFLMGAMDTMKTGWAYWQVTPDDGYNPKLVELLVRTYPLSVSGHPVAFNFHPPSGSFRFIYVPSTRNDTFHMASQIFASKQFTYPSGLTCQITPSGAANWKYENNIVYVTHTQQAWQISQIEISIRRKF